MRTRKTERKAERWFAVMEWTRLFCSCWCYCCSQNCTNSTVFSSLFSLDVENFYVLKTRESCNKKRALKIGFFILAHDWQDRMTPSWVDERVIGLSVPTPRFPRNTPGKKNAVLNLIFLNEWKYDVWGEIFRVLFFFKCPSFLGHHHNTLGHMWRTHPIPDPKNGSKGRALSWCCCCTLLYLLWGTVCCRGYLPLLLNIQDESRTCHATQQHMLSLVLKKKCFFCLRRKKALFFEHSHGKRWGNVNQA